MQLFIIGYQAEINNFGKTVLRSWMIDGKQRWNKKAITSLVKRFKQKNISQYYVIHQFPYVFIVLSFFVEKLMVIFPNDMYNFPIFRT